MKSEQRGHEQQQPPRPQQPEDGLSGVVFQHARYLAAAKALLGKGQRSEAKQLLQAVVAQGLRLLQTGPQPDDNKDKDKDMQLGLQQLHVQALILLGKAHGLAPIESESDAAAHCFLLAARGPCAPLRPLALGNLRLAFARVAALSGGGGAHRLASLHWDGERHAALVAAAVGGFRSWEKQQVRGMSATKRRRPVVLVAGPMAAMLALLLGRALQGRGKEAEPEAEPEAEAGVLVVEDSRVAKTLGKVALEASGLAVGKPGCPVLGFVESRVLLQRLCAGAGAGAKAQGALVEEGKGMEDGEEGKALQGQGVATEEDEVVYAGMLFDPFPYTLPTLPLKILAALHRRQEQEQRSGAGLPFCVPDALRFQAQVVESAELRTLSQAAPDKDGVVDGFQLGAILDALGRRAVPIDPGSFSHRPLSSPCISALLPLTSLLPLVAAGAGAEARVLERTWTVPLASKGRLDAVVFWWEAGVLLPQSKGGINDDDDDMRVLISCAPPPALLAEGCRAGALPLVPLEELHRWQMAWLDFARFEADPAVPIQLQLRLSSPPSTQTQHHHLPLSLHFLPPTHAPPLVDPDQPAQILDYHLPMVNDGDRNAAYYAWLRWALAEKKRKATQGGGPIRVLDIGAGSGLLGLMAARAAQEAGVGVEVVCLEKVPVLAAAAGWAAEENGCADVTVVNELSSDMASEDLGGPFDVLVSEILGDQPLSESMLPTFRHARQELLRPDALILPGRLTLWVTVARIDGLERVCSFPSSQRAEGMEGGEDEESSCDWRGWDAVLEQPLSLHLSAHRHTTLLDGPLRLGEIDLAAPDPLPLSGTLEAAATISRDGDANALVLWWEVGLGEEGGGQTPTISTGPAHGQRPHWKQVVYPLVNSKAADAAKGLCAGERLSLRASYDRDRLRLQVVGRDSPAAVGVGVAQE